MEDSFTRDIKAYLQHLPQLLAEKKGGQFVLIHSAEKHDVYATFDEGMNAGYRQFGPEPFLVQQIDARDVEPKFAQMLTCPA